MIGGHTVSRTMPLMGMSSNENGPRAGTEDLQTHSFVSNQRHMNLERLSREGAEVYREQRNRNIQHMRVDAWNEDLCRNDLPYPRRIDHYGVCMLWGIVSHAFRPLFAQHRHRLSPPHPSQFTTQLLKFRTSTAPGLLAYTSLVITLIRRTGVQPRARKSTIPGSSHTGGLNNSAYSVVQLRLMDNLTMVFKGHCTVQKGKAYVAYGFWAWLGPVH